jgi:drug/metabolite transporter superfamily protein YnfA
MLPRVTGVWAKIALVIGLAVLFFTVSGILSVASPPKYFGYFYAAATGLTLIAAALVSMIEE